MPFARSPVRRAILAVAGGVLAAAVAVPAGTATAAPVVTTTRLPVPAGATDSSVYDLNNSGVAVGTATVNDVSRAIRWSGTGFTELPATADRPSAAASGINDAGLIAGTLLNPATNDRVVRRWLPGGATSDCPPSATFPLGVLAVNAPGDVLISGISGPRRFTAAVCHPDGTVTQTGLQGAYAIGDDGRVAGFKSIVAGNESVYVPVVVAADGTATELPVPAGQSGVAYDVGPGGSVVGALGSVSFSTGIPVFVPRVAVVWVGGRTVELGTLGGTTSQPASTGRAVSRTGDVIGTSQTASGQTHAFLWRAGRMIDLGTLGGSSSAPTAINDRGQVTGSSLTASGQRHAFLYSGGRMIDLGAQGGQSSSAVDINNAGQIVGTVSTADGATRAVRWTVR
jgi:probable HAF family extracellular repeat protein